MALCISAECFRAKFAFCTPQHSEVVLPQPGLTLGIPQPRGDPIPPTPGAGSCWESGAALCVCVPHNLLRIFLQPFPVLLLLRFSQLLLNATLTELS